MFYLKFFSVLLFVLHILLVGKNKSKYLDKLIQVYVQLLLFSYLHNV